MKLKEIQIKDAIVAQDAHVDHMPSKNPAIHNENMKIACIGGGTGLFTLLSSLKVDLSSAQISAIVAMSDSGGSTGRLRDEFGYLPPGDIRQCLVALSEAPEEMRRLMQHRFSNSNSSLTGHVIGNLLLTALKDIHGGDEYDAIESMEKLLRIKGKVYPVTIDNAQLVAVLEDGSVITGEKNIDLPMHNPELKISSIFLQPKANLFSNTKEAILNADYITIGPGDLYTSIVPNLVVLGMKEALQQAQLRGSKIIYITNTMTKNGETNNFTASDFVNVIERHVGKIDAVIINTKLPSEDLLGAYRKEHAEPVKNDIDPEKYLIIARELLKEKDFARHDGKKLSLAIRHAIHELEKRTK